MARKSSDRFTLEAVYVPFFRAGAISSTKTPRPNIAPRIPFRHEPGRPVNSQGGVHAATSGGSTGRRAPTRLRAVPALAIAAGIRRFRSRSRRFPLHDDRQRLRDGQGAGACGRGGGVVERSLQTAGDRERARLRVASVWISRVLSAEWECHRRTEGQPGPPSIKLTQPGALRRSVVCARDALDSMPSYTIPTSRARSPASSVRSVFAKWRSSVGGAVCGEGADVLARFADRDFLYLD